ncbi:MAG: site-specific integrase, partial [Bacteroidota bacterium]
LEKEMVCLPASIDTIAAYILNLEDHYKLSSLQRKVSSISKAHQEAGYVEENPVASPQIRELMKGLRRDYKSKGQTQAPAIRLAQITPVCQGLLADGGMKAVRDRAIILIGFFGAFRRSEVASLMAEDIQRNENGLTITLRYSKTDQEGEGFVKAFPYRADMATCPVRALDLWQNNSGSLSGILFRSVDRWGNVKDKSISDRDVDRIVRYYFGPDYSAHSLRAGFVTEAAAKGANTQAIMRQTGHKSAPTVQRYTRFNDAWEGNAVMDI